MECLCQILQEALPQNLMNSSVSGVPLTISANAVTLLESLFQQNLRLYFGLVNYLSGTFVSLHVTCITKHACCFQRAHP